MKSSYLLLLLLLLGCVSANTTVQTRQFLNREAVDFQIDTLLQLTCGDDIPDYDIFDYLQFTLMDDSILFLCLLDTLYKYDLHTASLCWKKALENYVLDLTIYKDELYMLEYIQDYRSGHMSDWSIITVLDAHSADTIRTITLDTLEFSYNFSDVFFYQHYIFFDEKLELLNLTSSLKYVYDLDRGVMSQQLQFDPRLRHPIENCERCDRSLLINLFDSMRPEDYLGESSQYLLFQVFFVYGERGKSFLLKKEDGSIKSLSPGEIEESHYISGNVYRSVQFINDTTFIYYYEIPDKERGSSSGVNFLKLDFQPW